MPLTLSLLGPPSLERNHQPLKISRRKSRALLYYLATHAHPLTREQLLAFFWPDHERSAAQQQFRTTLYGLRKALGDAIHATEETISLGLSVAVDTRQFEAALAQPTGMDGLAKALALYRGDFLTGFSLPGNAGFDTWLMIEGERFRRLAVHGFTLLAQAHEEAQEYRPALAALDQALAIDPLQEDLQQGALRLHYLAGDRAGAIWRYDSLRKMLDEELGVPPMAETRQIYDGILADRLPPPPPRRLAAPRPLHRSPPEKTASSPPPAGQLPFVGRAQEFQRLHAAVAAGRLVLLEGAPGIGKTRLGHEFLQASGKLGLQGTARELEQAIPYLPILEALRGLLALPGWPEIRARLDLPAIWLAETARLLPEVLPDAPREQGGPLVAVSPASSSPPSEEARLWEGLAQFVRAVAWQRPVLLFLDDIHWADTSTLALLGYLLRHTGDAPVSFMLAARAISPQSPLGVLVASLTRENRLERIELDRLSPEAVRGLAENLCSSGLQEFADWLATTSEGNPYILAELVRYARNAGIFEDGEVNLAALPKTGVLPQTVYSLIQSRLAKLPDEARRVLDVAVTVGREFEFELVEHATGLSAFTVLDALDLLQAVGLVVPQAGMRYAFDHSLTLEVARQELGETRARLLHRRVAEALERLHRGDLDAVAGLLAAHYLQGGVPARGAEYARRAGKLAFELAGWAEAVSFFEQALEHTPDGGARFEILLDLADTYTQAGQMAKAAEHALLALTQAQALGDARGVERARFLMGQSLLAQGRYAESAQLARQILAGPRVEKPHLAEFLWGTALSLEGADLAQAANHLARAEQLSLREEDPLMLALVKFELGSVAAQRGDLPAAVALYRESLGLTEELDSEPAVGRKILAHNNLAYHLLLLEDAGLLAEAVEHAETGLHLANEKGALGLQPYLLSTRGEIALAQGDLAGAESFFTRGLALAENLANPERVAGLTANLGLLARQAGETALAIHRLSSALAKADALGTHHLAAQIRIWLAPLLPDAEAQVMLAQAREIAESGGRARLLAQIDQLLAR